MNVSFWRDTDRLRNPAWRGGFPEKYLQAWEDCGRSPLALAALQWRNVIERTREERETSRPERYLEVRYEDFLRDPEAVSRKICECCDLAPSRRIGKFITNRLRMRPPSESFRERLSPEDLDMLQGLLGDLLTDLGYSR